jgi:hypothetical protein
VASKNAVIRSVNGEDGLLAREFVAVQGRKRDRIAQEKFIFR